MPRKILVGLWSRKTDSLGSSASSTHRLTYLTAAAIETEVQAELRGINPEKGKIQSILIAPEFLFMNPREYVESQDPITKEISKKQALVGSTGMDKSSRDFLLGRLERISSNRPGMLIIPGTIVFKEVLTRGTLTRATENLTRAINPVKTANEAGYTVPSKSTWEQGKKVTVPPTVRPYMNREYRGVEEIEKSGKRDEDKAVDYHKMQLEQINTELGALSSADQNQVIKQPSILKHSFLIKNRAYIFLDGKKIFSFGKKTNIGDFNKDTERGIFVPGKKASITQTDGLKIGFEICYDHDQGILKGLMGTAANLDLQIICSADVPNTTNNFVVKEGGYVLHASSFHDYSQVHQRPSKKGALTIEDWAKNRKKPLKAANVDGDPLDFYEIELP